MFKNNENSQKLIEELKKKHAAKTLDSDGLPPPDDLPPVFVDAFDLPPERLPPKLLDDKGTKLLNTLENKFKEFFKVGDCLSEKAKNLENILKNIEDNLDQFYVSKMGEEGETAFIIFLQNLKMSTKALSELSDPVPTLSAQTLSNLNLIDIQNIFVDLRNRFVDPNQNGTFKARAIACILLTLAFGKLIKCQKDVFNKVDVGVFSEMSNLLIAPVQRLSQLGLFAGETLAIFEKLLSRDNISESDMEIIVQTQEVLKELLCRSKLIGLVMNKLKEAVDLVAMDTLDKRFSEVSLQQLEFFKALVPAFVQLTMEAEFNSELISQIMGKLDLQLESKLSLESAKFYRKLSAILEKSYLEPKAIIPEIAELKTNLKTVLCIFHEEISMDDKTKLELMIGEVKSTQEILENKLKTLAKNSLYSAPQSGLEKQLKSVLEQQNDLGEKAVARI